LNFQTDFLEEKWKKDYDHLKKEHELFIEYFDKNRSCRCDIDICRHLQKAEKEMFNPKYHELVNRQIVLGTQSLANSMPEMFEKSGL